MVNYYLRRTARIPATIFAVATLTFGLIRLLPGGPFTQLKVELFRQGMDAEQVNRQIEILMNTRPDAPLWQQYIDWMVAAAQGNLGQSIDLNRPVTAILAQAVPWTVFLVVTSTVLMFIIGVLIGAVQAYWEGSRFDTFMSGMSVLVMAVPYYIFAVIGLYLFAHQYGIPWIGGTHYLPAAYAASANVPTGFNLAYALSVLHHAILPIISYTIGGIGSTALNMRGNSIQVLGKDYVEVARLRGLPDGRIATRYVAQNAILPMYTGLLLLIGFRLGGTVVLERIFNYPGLGYYMIQAVNARDYPVMMGSFLVITITLIIAVYIADLTYGLIDPRLSAGERDEF